MIKTRRMLMHTFYSCLIFLLFCFVLPCAAQERGDDLDQYVERLKKSKATFGSETAFMSIGSDFLYAQEYFEAKNYSSAAYGFLDIVKKEKGHVFANYQLAVALLMQNSPDKTKQAQEYLQHAFRLNPKLKERFEVEIPTAKTVASKPAVGVQQNAKKGLDGCIEQLFYSRATGGKETRMNTAGLDVVYGYEYYKKGEYSSAEIYFRYTLSEESKNPYINYLMSVVLVAQGKRDQAQPYYSIAASQDVALKNRFVNDAKVALEKHEAYEESLKVKTSPVDQKTYGGAILYGDYTCRQTVFNGAGASPAFSFLYKGYFELKKDGTYRWLDNGGTGRYSYNAKTGNIKCK